MSQQVKNSQNLTVREGVDTTSTELCIYVFMLHFLISPLNITAVFLLNIIGYFYFKLKQNLTKIIL